MGDGGLEGRVNVWNAERNRVKESTEAVSGCILSLIDSNQNQGSQMSTANPKTPLSRSKG